MTTGPYSLGPHGRPARAWQRMLSGRRLDLLAPSADDIAIEDIAHGLARVARWNGQTSGAHAFSVAQHSLLVTDIVAHLNPHFDATCLRAALLHDAPEYVIGDLISPFKSAIGLDYKAFELRLLAAIHARFDIPPHLAEKINEAIKDGDRIAAYYEATVLAGFSAEEAQIYFGPIDLVSETSQRLSSLVPMPANDAQNAFLERFFALASN
ncbi:MAG TPA: HD family hydrolase [Hyphomicrobium sp.]|nr:HD family hydrolase [Hyphomicrobium sp.]